MKKIFEMELERSTPWLVETSINYMVSFLKRIIEQTRRRPVMLETGMGGSTIFFGAICNLTSLEHDPQWVEIVSKKVPANNFVYFCLAERPYNNQIEDEKDESFDIILIDGRDRVKCIISSIPKLKPGGLLVLDNSERPYYQKGMDLMKDWNRIDFKQNRPDPYGFHYPDWTTSIFIKP